jgi:hypothetical protein
MLAATYMNRLIGSRDHDGEEETLGNIDSSVKEAEALHWGAQEEKEEKQVDHLCTHSVGSDSAGQQAHI